MQCNGQTNDEFKYRWNNYKDNNQKSLRGEDHKQTGFFAHFQTAGHNGLLMTLKLNLFRRRIPLTLLDVRILDRCS